MEKKIIINSCRECPYCQWVSETEYCYGHFECKKFDLRNNDAYNANIIDKRCNLAEN